MLYWKNSKQNILYRKWKLIVSVMSSEANKASACDIPICGVSLAAHSNILCYSYNPGKNYVDSKLSKDSVTLPGADLCFNKSPLTPSSMLLTLPTTSFRDIQH